MKLKFSFIIPVVILTTSFLNTKAKHDLTVIILVQSAEMFIYNAQDF